MRAKFRGDWPNGIEVHALQRHLAVSESKMDSLKAFSGKKYSHVPSFMVINQMVSQFKGNVYTSIHFYICIDLSFIKI